MKKLTAIFLITVLASCATTVRKLEAKAMKHANRAEQYLKVAVDKHDKGDQVASAKAIKKGKKEIAKAEKLLDKAEKIAEE